MQDLMYYVITVILMHCVHFLVYTVVLYILVLQLFSQYRLLLPTLL